MVAHGDALATAIEEARRLYESGELAEAQAVLGEALAGVPEGAQDAETVAADRLYAAVVAALGEPQTARPWAARAYATGRDVLGPAHPETLAAAATLASVLRSLGHNGPAARLYAYLAEALSTVDGPCSVTALAARADLASVWYADGDCDRARMMLAEVYALHRDQHGEAHPATIKMAARLGRMARDCGDTFTAQEYFDEARVTSYRHLGPDDPLTTAIAELASAPADPNHTCREARPTPSQRPDTAGPRPPRWLDEPRDARQPRRYDARPVAPYAPPPRPPVPAGGRRHRSPLRTFILVVLAILLAVALGLAGVALARARGPQSARSAGIGAAPVPTALAGPSQITAAALPDDAAASSAAAAGISARV